MAKLGWITDKPDLGGSAEHVMRDLIERAGGLDIAGAAHCRKNDPVRANAETDPYALKAWCWHILARANGNLPRSDCERGTVNLDFPTNVARPGRLEGVPGWLRNCWPSAAFHS